MKTYLDCIPCFFRQALNAAKASTTNEDNIKLVLDRVAGLVPQIALDQPPPETARIIYTAIKEITGVSDPFKAHKEKSISNALGLYDEMKTLVAQSHNPLRTAVKLAIIGNVIDLGANPDFDIETEIKQVMARKLTVDHYIPFMRAVEKAKCILYLGDNAGETVFDRILIENLGKETIYVVRDAPIINDATMDDAHKSGLGDVARIISSGCDAPGTILQRCSRDFLDLFASAEVIISKGQGNLESLSGVAAPIFFLLMVKCPVIAKHVGADTGDMIISQQCPSAT